MKLSQMMIMNIYTAASGLSLHLVMTALLVSTQHTQHFYTVVRTQYDIISEMCALPFFL